MNDFIVDGVVENLAFLSVKYITFSIFSQTDLATRCTGGTHRWIKQRKGCSCR